MKHTVSTEFIKEQLDQDLRDQDGWWFEVELEDGSVILLARAKGDKMTGLLHIAYRACNVILSYFHKETM